MKESDILISEETVSKFVEDIRKNKKDYEKFRTPYERAKARYEKELASMKKKIKKDKKYWEDGSKEKFRQLIAGFLYHSNISQDLKDFLGDITEQYLQLIPDDEIVKAPEKPKKEEKKKGPGYLEREKFHRATGRFPTDEDMEKYFVNNKFDY